MAVDWGIDIGVPDVCDIVTYKGDRYRVTGWMKEMLKRKPFEESLESHFQSGGERLEFSKIFDDILYEAQQEVHGKKLKWCYRDEAQFVTLAGVGGGIAPVDEVTIVGNCDGKWEPEHIKEAKNQANLFAEKGDVLF